MLCIQKDGTYKVVCILTKEEYDAFLTLAFYSKKRID